LHSFRLWAPDESTSRPPVFDLNVLILDIPSLTRTTAKSVKVLAVRLRRGAVEKSD